MLRTKFSGVALTSSKRDYLFNYFVDSEDVQSVAEVITKATQQAPLCLFAAIKTVLGLRLTRMVGDPSYISQL